MSERLGVETFLLIRGTQHNAPTLGGATKIVRRVKVPRFSAGFTLLRNEHVRIDVIAGRLSPKAQAWIDIFGTVFFLLPMAIAFIYMSWPIAVRR